MKTDMLDIKPTSLQLISARKSKFFKDIYSMLRCIDSQKSFNVKDVLIYRDEDKKVSTIGKSNIPKKWIVVYKDNDNLIYAVRILKEGKISKLVRCLTCDHIMNGRYEIDPLIVDSILIDEEYNPIENMKAFK